MRDRSLARDGQDPRQTESAAFADRSLQWRIGRTSRYPAYHPWPNPSSCTSGSPIRCLSSRRRAGSILMRLRMLHDAAERPAGCRRSWSAPAGNRRMASRSPRGSSPDLGGGNRRGAGCQESRHGCALGRPVYSNGERGRGRCDDELQV